MIWCKTPNSPLCLRFVNDSAILLHRASNSESTGACCGVFPIDEMTDSRSYTTTQIRVTLTDNWFSDLVLTFAKLHYTVKPWFYTPASVCKLANAFPPLFPITDTSTSRAITGHLFFWVAAMNQWVQLAWNRIWLRGLGTDWSCSGITTVFAQMWGHWNTKNAF